MTKPLSDDLREREVAAMEPGERCRGVAPRRWAGIATRYSSPTGPGFRIGLQACPHLTTAMLQERLSERGIAVSHDTVWRFLRVCGFGFKKGRRSPMNANART